MATAHINIKMIEKQIKQEEEQLRTNQKLSQRGHESDETSFPIFLFNLNQNDNELERQEIIR